VQLRVADKVQETVSRLARKEQYKMEEAINRLSHRVEDNLVILQP
jgi:hypothetical protein